MLHDPQLDPSVLANSVIKLLRDAGVPFGVETSIVEKIEDWEAKQVIPPGKYDNWPPGDAGLYCCPEEVSNHVSSTGFDSNHIVWTLKSNDIITDDQGQKWKFHTFWAGDNIKDGWVPKKEQYFLSSQPDHAGEIFQMVGSVVACMTRDRFVIEKVE